MVGGVAVLSRCTASGPAGAGAVLTVANQAWRMPSRCRSCECCALSSPGVVSRWLLPLLSRLLSVAANSSGLQGVLSRRKTTSKPGRMSLPLSAAPPAFWVRPEARSGATGRYRATRQPPLRRPGHVGRDMPINGVGTSLLAQWDEYRCGGKKRPMRTGTGLTVVAIGAILAFAVTTSPSFFNIQIAGWVIMLTGVVSMVLTRRDYSQLLQRLRPRARVVERNPEPRALGPGQVFHPPPAGGTPARRGTAVGG